MDLDEIGLDDEGRMNVAEQGSAVRCCDRAVPEFEPRTVQPVACRCTDYTVLK